MHSAPNVIFRADATRLRKELGVCIVGHDRILGVVRGCRASRARCASVCEAAPTREEARAPHAGAPWTSGPLLNPTKDRMAFDIAYDGVLIRTRLHDALSGTDLMKMADAILAIEAATAQTPARLTDLREVTHEGPDSRLLQCPGELATRWVAWQLDAAITSSRTKCSRMAAETSGPWKWQRTESRIASRNAG